MSTFSAAEMPIVFTEFDTAKVECAFRYEAWRENIGVVFDVTAPDDDVALNGDYAAKITGGNLGDALLGVTAAPSQFFSRSPLRVTRDEKDLLLVQLFLRGGGTLPSKENLTAGDMLVIDMDQPHEMLNSDFEHLTLVLPRSFNSELSSQLAALHATRIAGDNPMVRLFGEHLCNLWRNLGDMNMRQAGVAMQGTAGLMQAWLTECNTLSEDPATAVALKQSIRRYIERNLAQPLPVEQLITTFRISRSQLYRLFEADGGVAHYLWERRLRRSLRMLLQAQCADMSIGSIAFACGFSSEAHFCRRFKAAFKMTPREVRERGLSDSLCQIGNKEKLSPTEFQQFFTRFSTAY